MGRVPENPPERVAEPKIADAFSHGLDRFQISESVRKICPEFLSGHQRKTHFGTAKLPLKHIALS